MLHVEIARCRRGRRQGGVLREAGRWHAGTDRHRRAGRPPRRHRRRVQLPLGTDRAVRQVARRQRPARAHHQLPRPLPLLLRQRPARRAVVAVPRRPGRPRREHRPAQPRRRPGAAPRRADRRGRRRGRDVHPPAPAARRRRHPLRPGPCRRPDRRRHQRGLVRGRRPLRRRGDGHLRGLAVDDRTREPARLRAVRHGRFRCAGTWSG